MSDQRVDDPEVSDVPGEDGRDLEDVQLATWCRTKAVVAYRKEFGRLLMGKRAPNRNAVLLLCQIIWDLLIASFSKAKRNTHIVRLDDGHDYIARARDEWAEDDMGTDFSPRTIDRQLACLHDHALIIKRIRPSPRHNGALIPHVRPHSVNINALLAGRPLPDTGDSGDSNPPTPVNLANSLSTNPGDSPESDVPSGPGSNAKNESGPAPSFFARSETETAKVPAPGQGSTVRDSAGDSPLERDSGEIVIRDREGRPDDDTLRAALIAEGLPEGFVDEELMKDRANCRQQLDAHRLIWMPGGRIKNPAAHLRAAITDRFPEPPQVKLIRDQERAARERRNAFQKSSAEFRVKNEARVQVLARLDAIFAGMSDEQRAALDAEAHGKIAPMVRSQREKKPDSKIYHQCLLAERRKLLAGRHDIDIPEAD